MNSMAKLGLFGNADGRTDVWATPQDLFNKLNTVFSFDLDVCALPENAKCERYFTPEADGLKQEWRGTCWMNPPYGREISDWIQKAVLATKKRNHCSRSIASTYRCWLVAGALYPSRNSLHQRTIKIWWV